MLISAPRADLEILVHAEHATEVEKQLAAYFEAVKGALSHNTERALRADVEIFVSWCRQHALAALPASATTLAAFIDGMARIKAPATVRRYVSSIAALHKVLSQTNPMESAVVKLALQRMHRHRGSRQEQVQGLTWPLRNRMLESAGDRLIDARNRALLTVAYDTLLRRSELVSLQVSDLLVDVDGSATLLVRSGKTDRKRCDALARDTVQLVQAWLEASGSTGGGSVRKDSMVGKKLDPARCRASTRGWRGVPGFPATSSTLWPGTARASGRFRT